MAFVNRYAVLAINFIAIMLLARLLTPAQTGLFSVARVDRAAGAVDPRFRHRRVPGAREGPDTGEDPHCLRYDPDPVLEPGGRRVPEPELDRLCLRNPRTGRTDRHRVLLLRGRPVQQHGSRAAQPRDGIRRPVQDIRRQQRDEHDRLGGIRLSRLGRDGADAGRCSPPMSRRPRSPACRRGRGTITYRRCGNGGRSRHSAPT